MPVTLTAGFSGCVVGISSQIAYSVTLSDTVIVPPAAVAVPLAVVAQPINLLLSGGINLHAGSVYAPAGTSVTSAIVPVPPLAAKLTVKAVTGGVAPLTVTAALTTEKLEVISSKVWQETNSSSVSPSSCTPVASALTVQRKVAITVSAALA